MSFTVSIAGIDRASCERALLAGGFELHRDDSGLGLVVRRGGYAVGHVVHGGGFGGVDVVLKTGWLGADAVAAVVTALSKPAWLAAPAAGSDRFLVVRVGAGGAEVLGRGPTADRAVDAYLDGLDGLDGGDAGGEEGEEGEDDVGVALRDDGVYRDDGIVWAVVDTMPAVVAKV